MEDIAARHAAESLLAEHKANVRFKPLSPPDRPTTISDAYDIQERYVALLRSENGDDVGYKVGLTSAPMQAFCGIDHPIAGVVLAKRVHRSRATVQRSDFGRLGLEFEIAVRIKSDVPVTGVLWTAEMIERLPALNHSSSGGGPGRPRSASLRSVRLCRPSAHH